MRVRRRVVAAAALAALLVAAAASTVALLDRPADRPTGPRDLDGWDLAWADEFNGDALDRRDWSVEDRSTFGEGNEELACLMDRADNLRVSAGALRLQARRERTGLPCGAADRRFPAGRPYSSAMISTQGKRSWTYGRFEIRARLPVTHGFSQGLWPAFWLRPDDGELGEIDVLEALGTGAGSEKRGKVHQTIWYDYNRTHPPEGNTYSFPSSKTADDGWHTYTLEWTPRKLIWLIDGRPVYQRSPSTTPWFEEAFSRPFFLRLNLAVGGRWPGAPVAETRLPASFDVDYVRVWRAS